MTGIDLRFNVIAAEGGAIYLRLPEKLQVSCNGCDCDWCKAHPDLEPKWDTLAVPVHAKVGQDHAWTLHMPDPERFRRAIREGKGRYTLPHGRGRDA